MTYFIFDLGQVIIHYEPLDYLLSSDLTMDQVEEAYEKIFKDEIWHSFDRGDFSIDQGSERIAERSSLNEETIREILSSWPDILYCYPSSIGALERLKKRGYKLYYLSNFPDEAFDRAFERLGLKKYFYGGICSAKVNHTKPDREIYQILIDRYDLDPEEGIFIDDKEKNCQAAEKMGFKSLHFTGPNLLFKLLKDFY